MNAYQKQGHRLHKWGGNVTCTGSEKKPLHTWKEWQHERQNLDDVNALPWLEAAGVGFISGPGGFRGYDFDEKREGYPPIDFAVVATVLAILGLPESYPWVWRSGSGKGLGRGRALRR